MAATIWSGAMFEDSGVSLMARVVGNDAANIVQADCTTILRSIYNAATGAAIEEDESLTIADVVFDTLQTDNRWLYDTTGYNFRDPVPAAKFAAGSTGYRVEYKFTPASGEVWHVVFQIAATELLGS